MKRDFTNSTKIAINKLISERNELFTADISYTDLFHCNEVDDTDIIVFLSEIYEKIVSANAKISEIVSKLTDLGRIVDKFFKLAQNVDSKYADEINEDSKEISYNYFNNLRALIEAIDVSGMGDTQETMLEYLENEGKDSVFGNPDEFNERLAEVKGTLSEQVFNDIVTVDENGNVVIDYDKYEEFVNQPIEEFDEWDMNALQGIYMLCINPDGSVNCERLQKLINHSYTTGHTLNGTGTNSTYTITYELSPAVQQLATEMANNAMIYSIWLNTGDNSSQPGTEDFVAGYCALADTLYVVNSSWASGTYSVPSLIVESCGGIEALETPITISVVEEKYGIDGDTDMISVSSLHPGDDAVIHIYSHDPGDELDDALGTIAEEMDPDVSLQTNIGVYLVESSTDVMSELIGSIPVIGDIYGWCEVGINLISGGYEASEEYREDVALHEFSQAVIESGEVEDVLTAAGASGTVIQQGNDIQVHNIALDYAFIKESVDAYNSDSSVPGTLKYDDVVAEFEAYLYEGVPYGECPSMAALVDYEYKR